MQAPSRGGNLPPDFDLSPDVAQALAEGRPLVAIESAVIEAALPYPENLALLERMCGILAERQVTPAVLALLDGRVKVGLTEQELGRLAESPRRRKVSRRDLAVALAGEWPGATTVASSLWIAGKAGIPVFITGAIGGVHRGYGELFDVSADLEELARGRGVVVCGGAKPILDVPSTLELLETKGVPVLGWRCDGFPLYLAEGDGAIDMRVENARQVADVLAAQRRLDLEGSLLVAVPPPADVALEPRVLENLVVKAVAKARQEGVGGAAVTGFVLKAVAEATAGRSDEIKRAVLCSNAAVAADIAVAAAGGRRT